MGFREILRAGGGTIFFLAVELGAAKLSDRYGWRFVLVVAALGMVPLVVGWWPELRRFHADRSGRVFYLAGMLIGGAVFAVCAALYFWPHAQSSAAAAGARKTFAGIEWDFDSGKPEVYFLSLSQAPNGPMTLNAFQADGINAGSDPISVTRMYIRSDTTNLTLPVLFYLGHPELVDPKDTRGIPPKASFRVQSVPINSLYQSQPIQIPVGIFLKDFSAFTFVVEADGKKYERQFSAEEVRAQIAMFATKVAREMSGTPSVYKAKGIVPAKDVQSPEKLGPITWTYGDGPHPIFSMRGNYPDRPLLASMQFTGRNNSDEMVTDIDGFVKSEASGQTFPLYFFIQGKYVLAKDIAGIPPHTDFMLVAPLTHDTQKFDQYILPEEKFLNDFPPLTLHVALKGQNPYTKHFSAADLQKPIDDFDAFIREAVRKPPSIEPRH